MSSKKKVKYVNTILLISTRNWVQNTKEIYLISLKNIENILFLVFYTQFISEIIKIISL